MSQPSPEEPRSSSAIDEGYPSWLPKRPLHPAPPSTSYSTFDPRHGAAGPSESFPFAGIHGRTPAPRHTRMVSYLDEKDQSFAREPTDQTRVSIAAPYRQHPHHPRVWSRATGAGISPTLQSADAWFGSGRGRPRPTFRTQGLHLEAYRRPGRLFRLFFYLFPIFVFAHIPLQTFLDINVVFILFQAAKYPNPDAPDVPGSGKNWALGAAAYIACWIAWIFVVFILYELIYSFWRRWRIKNPLMIPLYLSSSGFNLVSMTSYTNFCFMRHLRTSAFLTHDDEDADLRDGLAETCWFYSQNLPTVALLLPRAGLSIALLLAFSNSSPAVVALANEGDLGRDGTFFRSSDGSLTAYARGILVANAAWTAWRACVLLASWIGLWIFSGSACAGICGPAYPWEQSQNEKINSYFCFGGHGTTDGDSDHEDDENRPHANGDGEGGGDDGSESLDDALPWRWKARTRARIWAAYEACLAGKRRTLSGSSSSWGRSKGKGKKHKGKRQEKSDTTAVVREPSAGLSLLPEVESSPATFEGVDQLLAAIGLPSAPPPARRGVLTGTLFDSPRTSLDEGRAGGGSGSGSDGHAGAADPRMGASPERRAAGPSEARPVQPMAALPYAFTSQGAQISSAGSVNGNGNGNGNGISEGKDKGKGKGDDGAAGIPFPPSPVHRRGQIIEVEEGERYEGQGEEEDGEKDEEDNSSEDPSSERASGSMSSLGQPIPSRYPFQFNPNRGSLTTTSSLPSRPQTQDPVSPSTMSHSTRSTGNRETTTDSSSSPRSAGWDSSSPGILSPLSAGRGISAIPMPPRHPQQAQGRGRARAGTAPSQAPFPPLAFPRSGQSLPQPRLQPSPPPVPPPPTASARTRTHSAEPAVYPPTRYEEVELEDYGDDYVLDQPEPEGPHEVAEHEDVVGLLSSSAGPSPRASFIGLRARARSNRSGGSGSGSGSNVSEFGHMRANSHSGSGSGSGSRSPASRSHSRTRTMSLSNIALARARAQSLVQNIGSASRSSIELVQAARQRSRANSSMARLEEDVPDLPPPSSSSGSYRRSSSVDADDEDMPSSRAGSLSVSISGGSEQHALPSSVENSTFGLPMFGHPLRMRMDREMELEAAERRSQQEDDAGPSTLTAASARERTRSAVSASAGSERTATGRFPTPPTSTPIPPVPPLPLQEDPAS